MSYEFESLWSKADAAGRAAAAAAVPAPMVVSQADVFGKPTPGGKSWYVAEGPCGFGWVTFKGNTAFGRWAKKSGKATKSYGEGGGLRVSSPLMTQSIARNEAYAYAFAAALSEAGIKAYGHSRMD
jgi:hypothetical protein